MPGERIPPFALPAPTRRARPVLPVFLPWAGCAGRCSFCAQDLQTGKPGLNLPAALADMDRALSEASPARPLEPAFYGGSFTALDPGWRDRFLELAASHRAAGRVSGVRCSTRPDAVSPSLLRELAAQGLDTVELGVQTFHADALRDARRGHGAERSREACREVKDAGLRLGVHLLPGLPGVTPGVFARDVEITLSLRPDFVRLHPLLVLAGSGLEAPWRAGLVAPWNLEQTVEALARACLDFWRAGVAVVRLGLAQEPSLEAAVLAGPRHPALGTMVRARALLEHVRELLAGRLILTLTAPTRASGEFWGHAGELEASWRGLGLRRENVRFEDREDVLVHCR
ncbi:Oxygen-independent coproporphyrinogen-III oxidase-like protein [Fundidesulfovibrio magnetotacticus]|uniref:Oxygen-independent coproporphyrinogen-III oxidase-like protein n=1 Tax=Fundidesulfovibrio magnetotacticus TaxID=2730080 RepID=A0A6V8M0E4_9BACT|nr:radical SAM protein [Fundidesulfovibrio magnetotacticus]GFK95337.1 Oxygen-independent coproporphyrinogen-III oxidase-like protein [Fundidesulfovibrio magnetotacticus]